MKLVTEIWHPNIEYNGDVCISILHEPGVDGAMKNTDETILISMISMLANPNDESEAVDAPIEWGESYPDFKRKVDRYVRKSQDECS